LSPWAAIEAISPGESVLIASDFDGTLAPLIDDPDRSTVDPGAGQALMELAALPGVNVAIVSGRSRPQLVGFFPPGAPFIFIGEHGNDTGAEIGSDPNENSDIAAHLRHTAEGLPGSWVEAKRHSAALHYRLSDPAAAEPVVSELVEWAGTIQGARVMRGKMILEIAVAARDKGDAVDALRRDLKPDRTVFIGDDVTDESVFGRMPAGDIGIKVGPGDTDALYRVADIADVSKVLAGITRRLAPG
jgi:trehalose 6-phosphate phosphatase